ncbi:hypothetical protein PVAP13_2NG242006 [Panicum virgatum]|uniref:Uncharacterized protein n=1 Tax=Panicum virgatum TaxID=38727 RepID=A0A8T0VEN4_PANVG|nr:hypothetical protein PVAP13_2NG242006 [Panicum virgatum]
MNTSASSIPSCWRAQSPMPSSSSSSRYRNKVRFWVQVFGWVLGANYGVLAWDKEMDAKGVEGEGGSKQG